MRQFGLRQFKQRQFKIRQFDIPSSIVVGGGEGGIGSKRGKGGDGGKIIPINYLGGREMQNLLDEEALIIMLLADEDF